MKKNTTVLMTAGFATFLLVVSELSEYLTRIVPTPHAQWIDFFSAVHAIEVAGIAFFILISTQNNAKLRNYAFIVLLALIFVWEIIENTALRETALAGQESLGNIGMDIFIGTLSMGIVFSTQNVLFSSKPKRNIQASKQINHKEP